MSPVERSSGGGGSFTSPLTTKGDIYGHSAVDARIPVGSDTQVLTANSVAALGVDYEYPPGHEFDYVQRTTDLTLTAAEQDWIVGNSVTYDGSTRVKIECFGAILDCSGSASTMGGIFRLYDGVSVLNRICDIRGTNTFDEEIYGAVFTTPSAGAHTYKITALQAGGVGTQVAHAGAVGGGTSTYVPAWIRVTKT